MEAEAAVAERAMHSHSLSDPHLWHARVWVSCDGLWVSAAFVVQDDVCRAPHTHAAAVLLMRQWPWPEHRSGHFGMLQSLPPHPRLHEQTPMWEQTPWPLHIEPCPAKAEDTWPGQLGQPATSTARPVMSLTLSTTKR